MTDDTDDSSFFKAFTLTLLGLLPMVNPPTTATLMLGLTRDMSVSQVNEQINRTAVYMFITVCITLFAGTSVLSFFGLTLPSLRLAGGLVISVIGFRMLLPSPAGRQTGQASGSIAFVPLTIPSLCGPGTMALVLSGAVQIADLPPDVDCLPLWGGMTAAFAALSVISWGVLKMATPVCRFMGESGIDALTRIMGFLLICMGMQFGITAVRDVVAGF
ncbi:MarC family NAAT transporter [Salmonella enterica]|uniref:MarC family NAAT transporter n=1 Tax=Salmonella enterica TaxID=28901 RepID=UPI000FBA31C7|nr:MarC family NAAT transporter [Salmonella enterica]EEC0602102.1 MarC family NAAT transporter [Salmonella enterica subsp. enterica]EAZ4461491.1 MarC family NAAT transporter [Salmonella enterica]MBE8624966.1 MarC family NAAT transporter [Salmonella enterica subsp. enterica serovar Hvittingfoss]MBE8629511.1 MarC family NAAT transporter [Salmonella enterica subsp. enterica serovar Hvittingfoss]MBE8638938.1 MarC family NAAT transporter [Salmonella enterica subsp. enterica serovar Hvittingfoss]